MESRVFQMLPINAVFTGTVTDNLIITPVGFADWGTFITTGAIGDLGIFDADTGDTILTTGVGTFNITDHPRIFIGTLQAGPTGARVGKKSDVIDGKCITAAQAGPAVPQTAKEITITGFTAECETEYCLKVRFESPRIYQTYDYQSLLKTYNFVSSCCGPSCECPDGDCDEVGNGIVAAINEDPDHLIEASYAGESAPGACDGTITIVGSFEDEGVNGINPTYVELNSPLEFYVGLDCGFDCNGVVTTSVPLVIGEGAGADVIHKELFADGWQTSPYRIPFPLDQKSLGNNFFALAANTYNQLTLEYFDCHPSAITAHGVRSPKKVTLAVHDAIPGTGASPDIVALLAVQLNLYLGTTPNAPGFPGI